MPTRTITNGHAAAGLLLLLASIAAPASANAQSAAEPYAARVEIIRTAFHVPHIRAADIASAYYALAWVQLEDYGPNTAINLLRARGEMGRWFGRDSVRGDFQARLEYAHAVENFHRLDDATRAAYEGFAAGVNRYIELNPHEFVDGLAPRFTAYDVLARDVTFTRESAANRFLARLARADSVIRANADTERDASPAFDAVEDAGAGNALDADPIEEGSNAWALAPSRTTSGRAILLRNPHLAWTAGYYEAHMTVPGVLDFYGDFRIGGPFSVIGGFNRDLGWATTNNAPTLAQIYELSVDPERADHYLFDGTSVALTRHLVTVEWKNGDGIATETRELWRSPLGPVVHRADGKIWVVKGAGDGDYRAGEQFLRMMRATSLDEWKESMRMRQRVTSSFTYADRAGNILYVWNASLPDIPHPNGRDTLATPAHATSDVWTRYVPWDSLPQFLNPRRGYVHNENDPPFYGNMHPPLDPARWGTEFPERPNLRLRSQLGIALIDHNRKLSLDDVVRLKHSYRMLLADRVKPDLVAAVRATSPSGTVAEALTLLQRWDNTTAPDSRGGVLFQMWWQQYTRGLQPDSAFARPWSPDAPVATPAGLRDPPRAAEAFARAVEEATSRYGSFDVPWGDVHRVRIGATDVPVGGCGGALGCFRVLNFRTDPDGKRSVIGGDGWVLAVEFGRDAPRAYSVLAYGNSNREDSPHFGDQAAMFARGEMKRVLFLARDVDAGAVTRYRPGAR
ncbi:MAG TPA: penicillin acylase family protein [Gemmatimonadaceae bacterium]|nr:penicillin acylase family protein [Gemmatimonadaceae bacterium]